MWPAFAWGPEGDGESAASEYGYGLMSIGDATAIRLGVTRAIRLQGGRFPPPLADLLEFVRAEREAPDLSGAQTTNECPACREEGTQARTVIVDRNGIASCNDADHRWAWKVRA